MPVESRLSVHFQLYIHPLYQMHSNVLTLNINNCKTSERLLDQFTLFLSQFCWTSLFLVFGIIILLLMRYVLVLDKVCKTYILFLFYFLSTFQYFENFLNFFELLVTTNGEPLLTKFFFFTLFVNPLQAKQFFSNSQGCKYTSLMQSKCMYSGCVQGTGRTYIYVLGTHGIKKTKNNVDYICLNFFTNPHKKISQY